MIDVSLTTVKVQNFDKTITTIPPYALVSDSFQNWRGMKETGARRVKRDIPIDMRSVGFLTKEQRADFISKGWLEADAPEDTVNLKVFRNYLEDFLRNHSRVHQGLTLLVRELQPGSHGLPLEIYFFANTTVWAEYEGIQSEVMEHVLSVVPKFGLRVYQRSSDLEKHD